MKLVLHRSIRECPNPRMVMVYYKMSIVNYKMVEQLEQFENHEKPFLQFFKLFFIFYFTFFLIFNF